MRTDEGEESEDNGDEEDANDVVDCADDDGNEDSEDDIQENSECDDDVIAFAVKESKVEDGKMLETVSEELAPVVANGNVL